MNGSHPPSKRSGAATYQQLYGSSHSRRPFQPYSYAQTAATGGYYQGYSYHSTGYQHHSTGNHLQPASALNESKQQSNSSYQLTSRPTPAPRPPAAPYPGDSSKVKADVRAEPTAKRDAVDAVQQNGAESAGNSLPVSEVVAKAKRCFDETEALKKHAKAAVDAADLRLKNAKTENDLRTAEYKLLCDNEVLRDKAWVYVDARSVEQGSFTLVELFELQAQGRVSKQLLISHTYEEMSMNLGLKLAEHDRVVSSREACILTAQALAAADSEHREASRQFQRACDQYNAARAALKAAVLSETKWAWVMEDDKFSNEVRPAELREKVRAGVIEESTAVFAVSNAGIPKTAGEVIAEWDEVYSVAHAKARVTTDAARYTALIDDAEACWVWNDGTAVQGPYALQQLRSLVEFGQLFDTIPVFHQQKPELKYQLRELLDIFAQQNSASTRLHTGALGDLVRKRLQELIKQDLKREILGQLNAGLDKWWKEVRGKPRPSPLQSVVSDVVRPVAFSSRRIVPNGTVSRTERQMPLAAVFKAVISKKDVYEEASDADAVTHASIPSPDDRCISDPSEVDEGPAIPLCHCKERCILKTSRRTVHRRYYKCAKQVCMFRVVAEPADEQPLNSAEAEHSHTNTKLFLALGAEEQSVFQSAIIPGLEDGISVGQVVPGLEQSEGQRQTTAVANSARDPFSRQAGNQARKGIRIKLLKTVGHKQVTATSPCPVRETDPATHPQQQGIRTAINTVANVSTGTQPPATAVKLEVEQEISLAAAATGIVQQSELAAVVGPSPPRTSATEQTNAAAGHLGRTKLDPAPAEKLCANGDMNALADVLAAALSGTDLVQLLDLVQPASSEQHPQVDTALGAASVLTTPQGLTAHGIDTATQPQALPEADDEPSGSLAPSCAAVRNKAVSGPDRATHGKEHPDSLSSLLSAAAASGKRKSNLGKKAFATSLNDIALKLVKPRQLTPAKPIPDVTAPCTSQPTGSAAATSAPGAMPVDLSAEDNPQSLSPLDKLAALQNRIVVGTAPNKESALVKPVATSGSKSVLPSATGGDDMFRSSVETIDIIREGLETKGVPVIDLASDEATVSTPEGGASVQGMPVTKAYEPSENKPLARKSPQPESTASLDDEGMFAKHVPAVKSRELPGDKQLACEGGEAEVRGAPSDRLKGRQSQQRMPGSKGRTKQVNVKQAIGSRKSVSAPTCDDGSMFGRAAPTCRDDDMFGRAKPTAPKTTTNAKGSAKAAAARQSSARTDAVSCVAADGVADPADADSAPAAAVPSKRKTAANKVDASMVGTDGHAKRGLRAKRMKQHSTPRPNSALSTKLGGSGGDAWQSGYSSSGSLPSSGRPLAPEPPPVYVPPKPPPQLVRRKPEVKVVEKRTLKVKQRRTKVVGLPRHSHGCIRAVPFADAQLLCKYAAQHHVMQHALRHVVFEEKPVLGGVKDAGLARTKIGEERSNRSEKRQLVKSDAVSDVLKWNLLKARAASIRFGRSKVHAWGLFAKEVIEPEQFVVEYVGDLVRSEVAERREKHYERCGLGSSYLFRVDDDWVVDATKKGGIARFINHSCDPNCYTKIITVEGTKHIVIYSKRTIQAGEELFYDYKFDYEDDDQKVPCMCGAKNCRGFMN